MLFRSEPTQYVSIRYSERLEEAGITPSVGSRGDSYDNALAETVNGLYKADDSKYSFDVLKGKEGKDGCKN